MQSNPSTCQCCNNPAVSQSTVCAEQLTCARQQPAQGSAHFETQASPLRICAVALPTCCAAPTPQPAQASSCSVEACKGLVGAAACQLTSSGSARVCNRKTCKHEAANGCGALANKRIEERAAAAAGSLRPQRIQRGRTNRLEALFKQRCRRNSSRAQQQPTLSRQCSTQPQPGSKTTQAGQVCEGNTGATQLFKDQTAARGSPYQASRASAVLQARQRQAVHSN